MRALLVVAIAVPSAQVAAETGVVTPSCASPAQLGCYFDPAAPHMMIGFKDGTKDMQAAAVALSKKYGFKILWMIQHAGRGLIVSQLTPDEIAQIRCEPDVEYVEYDARTSIS